MGIITTLKEGDKVHYIPYKDCDPSEYENGIVKRVIEVEGHILGAFVVYHCNNEWDNYENYTPARTDIIDLREGWANLTQEEIEAECEHYYLPSGGKWSPQSQRTCQFCHKTIE